MRQAAQPRQDKSPVERPSKSKSMHDGIPVWYDCCSCEAEPYWQQAMCDDAKNKGVKPVKP